MVNKTAMLGDNCAANSIIVSKCATHLLCVWPSHSAVLRNSLWTMAGFRVTSNRFLSLIVRIGTTFARRLVPRVVPIQPDAPFILDLSDRLDDHQRCRQMLNVPDVRIGERGDFVLKRHARFFGVVDTHLRDLLSPMTVLFRRLSYAPLSVSSLSLSLSFSHRDISSYRTNAQTAIVILAVFARRGINRALFKYSARFPNRFFKSLP